MSIFINIYNGWTLYEWTMVGGSLLSIFILINLTTYFLTRKIKFSLPISLTFLSSLLLIIFSVFIYTSLFHIEVSNISLISILITTCLITVNWFSFIGFYIRTRDYKKFSITQLFNEYRGDSIRLIIFITLSILAVSVFLTGEYLAMLVSTLLISTLSIYLNTILVRRFIND
ncbi:hypothetical protein K8R14_05110 [bacterium]|nr:hypothetical protein [bacterium]